MSLQAETFKKIRPAEYYKKFLTENIRPDGRDLWKVRKIALDIGSISSANGSALVRLGHTSVMCGIKAELADPQDDKPSSGYIIPNVDLPPLCGPKFRPGPPAEEAQVLTAFMNDVLTKSGMVDPKDLCISEGNLVWCLYVDVVCLSYDGNVQDACILAAVAALHNVKLPEIEVDVEAGDVKTLPSYRSPLAIKTYPISTTVCQFDGGFLLADPTREEEELASGTFTVVTGSDGNLLAIHRPGGAGLSDQQLSECVKFAQSRKDGVSKLLQHALTV
eukprot:Colp12_sorted_trinity150504_noHs@26308